jgi:hypothetical protein
MEQRCILTLDESKIMDIICGMSIFLWETRANYIENSNPDFARHEDAGEDRFTLAMLGAWVQKFINHDEEGCPQIPERICKEGILCPTI